VTGNVAEFGRQIDPGDSAAEAVCEVACRPAESATDVKNVVGWLGLHKPGDFQRRFQAATMELVVGASVAMLG
jgi:hypothetical protein